MCCLLRYRGGGWITNAKAHSEAWKVLNRRETVTPKQKGGAKPPFVVCPTPSGCVLRKAVAKIGGKALLHEAANEARKRRRNGDQQPQQCREEHSRNRHSLQ
jgi:hypothetical protein